MAAGCTAKAARRAITACTISGNTASGNGGGIYVYSGQYGSANAALTDTIVAGNTGTGGSASDIGGSGTGSGASGSYNLIGTGGSGGLTAADHNLLNIAAPALSALANNGGPTQTMALLTGSPAIGAGTAIAGVTTDQRGLAIDSPPDIGAYQTPPSHSSTLSFSRPEQSDRHVRHGERDTFRHPRQRRPVPAGYRECARDA